MNRLVALLRAFKKNPTLTFINVISMAFGLVATWIMAGYVYQELNYDSESIHSDRLYRIIQKDGADQHPYSFGPLARSLKSNYPEIEEAVRISFFYGYLPCTAAGQRKFNENMAIFADPEFFSMFSLPLIKGKQSNCLRSPNSVVLSEKAAKKYFGDDDPMGKRLQIGKDKNFMVTGVFRDFKSNSNFRGDLVLPLEKISKITQIWIEPSWEYESDIHTFVSLSENAVIGGLSEKASSFISEHVIDRKLELWFQPVSDIHINKQLGWESTPQASVKSLYILLIVAFLILCISIINFWFLYIGATFQRTTGIGIKKLCGASKIELALEHFGEVLMLMLMSILAAIIFYVVYTSWLALIIPFLPVVQLWNYKFALLLWIIVALSTLIAAIYPSVVLSSYNPLNLFSRKAISHGKFRLVNLLVVGQFTICIAMIVFTIMMQKQTRYMASLDTGYARDELITIPLNMHVGEGIFNERFEIFAQELKKYPGIKNVSLSYSSPSSVGTGATDVRWEGKPADNEILMNWESISYDYFETIGVTIKQGRGFNREFPNDEVDWNTREGAFILNERALREMEMVDPIGKEFGVWGFHGPIVGIAEDYNFKSMHSAITPMFYIMNPFFLNEIIVRIDPASPSVFMDIKTVWDRFVIDYPLEINFVNNQILALYKNDQDMAKLLRVFSLLAILIACMGLFTLTVMSLNQRTKEIGIRKVNGAKISDIFTLLNKGYIRLVGIAFLIASPVSWYVLQKWLDNFAYKTNMSWWIFPLAGLSALGIALLTVSWKSWQAALTNPVETLRNE